MEIAPLNTVRNGTLRLEGDSLSLAARAGEIHEYEFCAFDPTRVKSTKPLVDADSPLQFTLVWTDPPTPILSSRVLVNDLDLSVELRGRTYLGSCSSPAALDPDGN
jgi:hypothetical protein